MRRLAKGLIPVLILMLSIHAYGNNAPDLKKLNTDLQQWQEKFETPSLAVGIIKDGKVVFNRAYGKSNLKKNMKTTADTVYRIGSCSKAFTTAALAILVDEGKIKWDDKVRDHLPEFRLSDAYVSGHATVEDLLIHRIGFKTFDGDLLWYRTDYSADDILERIARLPLAHEFRTTKGYSNIMYIAAGKLIERVSGMKLEQFIAEKIFKPLGMISSTLVFDDVASHNNFAKPYKGTTELPGEAYEIIGAAGGVNTTVNDMLNWARMLLESGKMGENRVLSKESITTLFAPHMINPLGGMEKYMGLNFYLYGYGWNLFEYAGRKIVTHQGALPGYVANIILVPEEKLGIVTFTNELSMLPWAAGMEILDLYTGANKREWVADALRYNSMMRTSKDDKAKRLESARTRDTKPSLSQEKYEGIYRDDYYGDAEISIKDGKLYVSLLPTDGKLAGSMEHYHYDTFRIDFGDPYIPAGLLTFSLNEKGEIAGFSLKIGANDFNFENLNFRKIK